MNTLVRQCQLTSQLHRNSSSSSPAAHGILPFKTRNCVSSLRCQPSFSRDVSTCFQRCSLSSQMIFTTKRTGGVFGNQFRLAAFNKKESKVAEEEEEEWVSPLVNLVENWTWSWSQITPEIIAGPCPRTKEHIDELMDAGVTGFLSLQYDVEMKALEVDEQELYNHIINRGGAPTRLPVDLDNPHHQAVALPEAVRVLQAHLNAGRVIYVHSSLGQNRIALVLILFFTFLQRMPLEESIKLVGMKRPQAREDTDLYESVHAKALTEESRGSIALKNYKQISYPYGRWGDMELWLKEFLQLVKKMKKFLAGETESPIARELENM